jgi:hypothetical protein
MAEFYDRRTMPPIVPDTIPITSWGSSLFNLLTLESWNAVRHLVIARRGNLCQLCGRNPRNKLDVHEVWAYSMPLPRAVETLCGVQRLMGLAALCQTCHELFHPGLARVRGRDRIVRGHLKIINRWNDAEYEAYRRAMERRNIMRSQRMWVLDLSLIAVSVVVDCAKGWRLDPDGDLTHVDPRLDEPSRTAVLGLPFVFDGKPMPAVDPAEAYDGLLPEEGDFDFIGSMGDGVNEVPRMVRRPLTPGPAEVTIRLGHALDREQAARKAAQLAGVPGRPCPKATRDALPKGRRSWTTVMRETVRAMF